MVQNKIVVHYQDGRILKGNTSDFLPVKPTFRIILIDAPAGTPPVEVYVSEVKAVFFVKDFAGNPEYKEVKVLSRSKPVPGRKITVHFKDGETLVGITRGYDPNRHGFFVIPADHRSNNERCFIVSSATRQISFI